MTGFRANLLVQTFRPILQKQKKRELRILEVMKDIKENTLQHYYYYYYKTRDSFKIGTISVKEGRVIWGVSVEEKSYNKGNEIGYTWCTAFRILWVRENSEGPSYSFLNTSTPLPPLNSWSSYMTMFWNQWTTILIVAINLLSLYIRQSTILK